MYGLSEARIMNHESWKKGFTLIELVVSISILALLVLGAAQLFPRALGLYTRAEALTITAYLAQAQIETILGQEYESVSTGDFEPRHAVDGNFERQTAVYLIDPETFAEVADDRDLKRINVTVFYPTPLGERTYALSTIITRR